MIRIPTPPGLLHHADLATYAAPLRAAHDLLVRRPDLRAVALSTLAECARAAQEKTNRIERKP
jgi:hypothetical protein